jgi:hypothetical protein
VATTDGERAASDDAEEEEEAKKKEEEEGDAACAEGAAVRSQRRAVEVVAVEQPAVAKEPAMEAATPVERVQQEQVAVVRGSVQGRAAIHSTSDR